LNGFVQTGTLLLFSVVAQRFNWEFKQKNFSDMWWTKCSNTAPFAQSRSNRGKKVPHGGKAYKRSSLMIA
jgi:hypothetical protein